MLSPSFFVVTFAITAGHLNNPKITARTAPKVGVLSFVYTLFIPKKIKTAENQ